MSNNQNCAEAMDLMNSRIALGLLMASLTYALDASVFLLSDPNNEVIKWLGFGITILAALWIFRAVGPMLLKKFKSKFSHYEPESFITESFHKAIIKSWVITVAALTVLKVLERRIVQDDLPVGFYLNGLVFVMLFSASVVFLAMTHISDEDGHTEELIE